MSKLLCEIFRPHVNKELPYDFSVPVPISISFSIVPYLLYFTAGRQTLTSPDTEEGERIYRFYASEECQPRQRYRRSQAPESTARKSGTRTLLKKK
jgi:hypothetical protein